MGPLAGTTTPKTWKDGRHGGVPSISQRYFPPRRNADFFFRAPAARMLAGASGSFPKGISALLKPLGFPEEKLRREPPPGYCCSDGRGPPAQLGRLRLGLRQTPVPQINQNWCTIFELDLLISPLEMLPPGYTLVTNTGTGRRNVGPDPCSSHLVKAPFKSGIVETSKLGC